MTDRSDGDNWSCKTCKAPVKSSPPTNQHPTFYRPDALPVAQPAVECRKRPSTTWICLLKFALKVKDRKCLVTLLTAGHVSTNRTALKGNAPKNNNNNLFIYSVWPVKTESPTSKYCYAVRWNRSPYQQQQKGFIYSGMNVQMSVDGKGFCSLLDFLDHRNQQPRVGCGVVRIDPLRSWPDVVKGD